MKNFLVETLDWDGVQGAAEFIDNEQAVAAATRTFKNHGGHVRSVSVRDAGGEIVFSLLVGSTPKQARRVR